MIKIYIENSFDYAGAKIFITQERDGKRFLAKPVNIIFEEMVEAGNVKPSIELPYNVADEFLQALMQALNNKGIKPPEQSFLAGKLEATDLHLEDMRNVVYNTIIKDKGAIHVNQHE